MKVLTKLKRFILDTQSLLIIYKKLIISFLQKINVLYFFRQTNAGTEGFNTFCRHFIE